MNDCCKMLLSLCEVSRNHHDWLPQDLHQSAPSIRKLPSTLDVAIVSAARNQVLPALMVPIRNAATDDGGPASPHTVAKLMGTPSALLGAGLVNGSFDVDFLTDPQFGWSTRGAAIVTGGQGDLHEDDRVST